MFKIKNKMRKGFTLTELVVVITIIAILSATGVTVGMKQVAKARKTSVTTELQLIGNQIEEGVTDMGFLQINNDFNESNSLDDVVEYMQKLEKKYMNCKFYYGEDNDGSNINFVSNKDDATGESFNGFAITTEDNMDPWDNEYTIFYGVDSNGRYELIITSAGPDRVYSEGMENAYLNYMTESAASSFGDDIVLLMFEREI